MSHHPEPWICDMEHTTENAENPLDENLNTVQTQSRLSVGQDSGLKNSLAIQPSIRQRMDQDTIIKIQSDQDIVESCESRTRQPIQSNSENNHNLTQTFAEINQQNYLCSNMSNDRNAIKVIFAVVDLILSVYSLTNDISHRKEIALRLEEIMTSSGVYEVYELYDLYCNRYNADDHKFKKNKSEITEVSNCNVENKLNPQNRKRNYTSPSTTETETVSDKCVKVGNSECDFSVEQELHKVQNENKDRDHKISNSEFTKNEIGYHSVCSSDDENSYHKGSGSDNLSEDGNVSGDVSKHESNLNVSSSDVSKKKSCVRQGNEPMQTRLRYKANNSLATRPNLPKRLNQYGKNYDQTQLNYKSSPQEDSDKNIQNPNSVKSHLEGNEQEYTINLVTDLVTERYPVILHHDEYKKQIASRVDKVMIASGIYNAFDLFNLYCSMYDENDHEKLKKSLREVIRNKYRYVNYSSNFNTKGKLSQKNKESDSTVNKAGKYMSSYSIDNIDDNQSEISVDCCVKEQINEELKRPKDYKESSDDVTGAKLDLPEREMQVFQVKNLNKYPKRNFKKRKGRHCDIFNGPDSASKDMLEKINLACTEITTNVIEANCGSISFNEAEKQILAHIVQINIYLMLKGKKVPPYRNIIENYGKTFGFKINVTKNYFSSKSDLSCHNAGISTPPTEKESNSIRNETERDQCLTMNTEVTDYNDAEDAKNGNYSDNFNEQVKEKLNTDENIDNNRSGGDDIPKVLCAEAVIKEATSKQKQNKPEIFVGPHSASKTSLAKIKLATRKITKALLVANKRSLVFKQSEKLSIAQSVQNNIYDMLNGKPVPHCKEIIVNYDRTYGVPKCSEVKINKLARCTCFCIKCNERKVKCLRKGVKSYTLPNRLGHCAVQNIFQGSEMASTTVLKAVMKATVEISSNMQKSHSNIPQLQLMYLKWAIRDRLFKIMMQKPVPNQRELIELYHQKYSIESDSQLMIDVFARRPSELKNLGELIKENKIAVDTSDLKPLEKCENAILEELRTKYSDTAEFHSEFLRWLVRDRLCVIIKKLDKENKQLPLQNELYELYRRRHSFSSDEQMLLDLLRGKMMWEEWQVTSEELCSSERLKKLDAEHQLMSSLKETMDKKLGAVFNKIVDTLKTDPESNETTKSSHEEQSTDNDENKIIPLNECGLLQTIIQKMINERVRAVLPSLKNQLVHSLATDDLLLKYLGVEGGGAFSSRHLVKLACRPHLPSLDTVRQYLTKYRPTVIQLYEHEENAIYVEIPGADNRNELLTQENIVIDGNTIEIRPVNQTLSGVTIGCTPERNSCIEENNRTDAEVNDPGGTVEKDNELENMELEENNVTTGIKENNRASEPDAEETVPDSTVEKNNDLENMECEDNNITTEQDPTDNVPDDNEGDDFDQMMFDLDSDLVELLTSIKENSTCDTDLDLL